MTEKELRKLGRADLLEVLLAQTQESERLRQRLEEAEARLTDRDLHVQQAGDLAHAVLMVNGVMEAAQNAAKQYLENIERMEKDMVRRQAELEKLERETQERCEKLLADARKQADRIKRAAGNRKKRR